MSTSLRDVHWTTVLKMSNKLSPAAVQRLWRNKTVEDFGENEALLNYYDDEYHNYLAARFRYLDRLVDKGSRECVESYMNNKLKEITGHERAFCVGAPYRAKDCFLRINEYNNKHGLPLLQEAVVPGNVTDVLRKLDIQYSEPVKRYVEELKQNVYKESSEKCQKIKNDLIKERDSISQIQANYILDLDIPYLDEQPFEKIDREYPSAVIREYLENVKAEKSYGYGRMGIVSLILGISKDDLRDILGWRLRD